MEFLLSSGIHLESLKASLLFQKLEIFPTSLVMDISIVFEFALQILLLEDQLEPWGWWKWCSTRYVVGPLFCDVGSLSNIYMLDTFAWIAWEEPIFFFSVFVV